MIADRTTVGVLFRQAARYGNRPLIHYLSGDTWQIETWADMQDDVLAVASGLIDAGVRPGDHVVLLSENRLEWLYCDFGIQAAGAITVPIYPNTPEKVAQSIASDCQATFAIASNASMAAKLKAGGPLQRVALMEV